VYTSSAGDSSGGSLVRSFLGFEPSIRYHATSSVMTVSLVAAGLGVALVPDSISSISVGNSVVYRPVQKARQMIDVVLIHRRDEGSPCVRRLVDVIGTGDDLGQRQPALSPVR
jgi:DNA-binding transcriptional LysR family regulator